MWGQKMPQAGRAEREEKRADHRYDQLDRRVEWAGKGCRMGVRVFVEEKQFGPMSLNTPKELLHSQKGLLYDDVLLWKF
jgi:hypothetical protein